MRNIKLTIEYDGTNFCGWQVQARNQPTVQGEIEKALRIIFKKKIHLAGSGRTDSGVHALGQVANFSVDSKMGTAELLRALNANLPDDISIIKAQEVPLKFHAQFGAKRKTYRYTILNRPARASINRAYFCHVPVGLNLAAMKQAATALKGKKDFRSFMAHDSAAGAKEDSKNTVRTISRLTVKKAGDFIHIEIEANGFLYKMVRNIVGTLLDVGRGKLKAKDTNRILAAKDRKLASTTALAQGLCLVRVRY